MPLLAAVYPDAAAARSAVASLNVAGPEAIEVIQLTPDSGGNGPANDADYATPAAVFRDTDIATDTDDVTAPTLFVSAPVVGPLIVLGYGSAIAGVAGAVRGVALHETVLAALVKDALAAGYYVVVVHAAGDAIGRRARDLINRTMAEDTEDS